MSSDKIELLFVLPSLDAGGSQRVFLHMIRNLSRTHFDITLIVLRNEGELKYLLPDDIRIIAYHLSRTAFGIGRIFSAIRKLSPDIVMTTFGHLNLLVSLIIPVFRRKTLFIARESSVISESVKGERYPRLFKVMFRTSYHMFDHFICQSNAMMEDLNKTFFVDKKKMSVINNPVDFSLIKVGGELPEKWDPNGRCLISVGQLRKEKGYDRILHALKNCDFPFSYKIIGEGVMRPTLERIIAESSLGSKVQLAGSIPSPFGFIAQADCLLLGSYYEGFPNIILEANALGVPVVAWASPGGHNEIIIDGVNGWLVRSPDELCNMLKSRAYLNVDKERIIRITKERFGLERIIGQYEDLLKRQYALHRKRTAG
ncbi:MAG TPA: glycosyltransferase [Cyclobacteriaceae bacterium]